MYNFYPSSAKENLPIATETSKNILCLPIYPDLAQEDQEKIIKIIHGMTNN